MWTMILVTVVFSGSVTGGVAGNTAFLGLRRARWRRVSGFQSPLLGLARPITSRQPTTASSHTVLSAELGSIL
jgi:hypothetical protein